MLASVGASVNVPLMRLVVAPVGVTFAVYVRPTALGAPLGDAAALGDADALGDDDALDDPDAHAAAKVIAISDSRRMGKLRERENNAQCPGGTRTGRYKSTHQEAVAQAFSAVKRGSGLPRWPADSRLNYYNF